MKFCHLDNSQFHQILYRERMSIHNIKIKDGHFMSGIMFKSQEDKIMIGPAIIKDSNCDVKAVCLNHNKMIGFAHVYDYGSSPTIVETYDDEYVD
jgi:hypothetical protein